MLKKPEKCFCPNFFYFFKQKFFLGFFKPKTKENFKYNYNANTCIHIREDCENTFCLYMRLLRYDVQLTLVKKTCRNFYDVCNSEQNCFLVMGHHWRYSILCSEFSSPILIFGYMSISWYTELVKPKLLRPRNFRNFLKVFWSWKNNLNVILSVFRKNFITLKVVETQILPWFERK